MCAYCSRQAPGWQCLDLRGILGAAQAAGMPCCLLWVTCERCPAVSKRTSKLQDNCAAPSMEMLTFTADV